jgi:mycothiol synthase
MDSKLRCGPATIREARQEDLPTLYKLASEAFYLDHFSPQLLHEKLFWQPRRPEFEWHTFLAEYQDRPVGFMQAVARAAAGKAWIGLFAVETQWRRKGFARQMFLHVLASLPPQVTEIEVLAIPGNYFAPGLDPRYTPALAFVERLGFERFKDCVNMTVELTQPFDATAELAALAADGIEVRRARAEDADRLDEFFAGNFGEDWRFEAGLALAQDPPALHLALKDGHVLAFAAHSTQNREWGFFGPMGTAPAARGYGLGRVLLWRCLNDLYRAGHRTALIPWVGPIAFYAHWAGCRVERVFWRYRRPR